MTTINIDVKYSELMSKIKTHLALIGKRAKDANGNSAFEDISTSTTEDARVWVDLVGMGAELLVSTIDQVSGGYTEDGETLSFRLMSDRWKDKVAGELDERDLTIALSRAVFKYLWMYAVRQYLSIIRPAMDGQGLPPYAAAYSEGCDRSISTIISLAYLKRTPKADPNKDYTSITGEVVNED